MKSNAIALVEHLRADPNILQITGAESIGFMSVPGRSKLPHILIAGAEGGDAHYTLGSSRGQNVSHFTDSFVVYAACAGSETQSDMEECQTILDAVEVSLSQFEFPGVKTMYLRYQRPARTEWEQRTTSDDILRMGHIYEYGTAPLI